MMLDYQQVNLIEAFTIGCVATVREDGRPAVSPKGTFVVCDERSLAFANIRSDQTVANLRRHPDVEVNFVDVFARKACRVRGTAHYIVLADADDTVQTPFRKKWPDLFRLVKGFVMIDVTAAETLTSPIYDTGAAEDGLVDEWLHHYASAFGYELRK